MWLCIFLLAVKAVWTGRSLFHKRYPYFTGCSSDCAYWTLRLANASHNRSLLISAGRLQLTSDQRVHCRGDRLKHPTRSCWETVNDGEIKPVADPSECTNVSVLRRRRFCNSIFCSIFGLLSIRHVPELICASDVYISVIRTGSDLGWCGRYV